MPLTVRDIMETDVPPVYPEDPIEKVVQVMREEQSDLHLPHVIELWGGVVFLESTKKFEERLRKAIGWLAQDVMTEEPITIHPDATVGEAAREIARNKHNRLPVVEHGRLVGVVTRIDVLDALTAD